MKGKRTFSYLALLGLLMALAIPLAAAADGCPPENPNCRIEPPQSIQVNANPMHADGSPVELPEPGMLAPQLIPMPLPPRVELLPLLVSEASGPSFDTLSIPMRHQDPGDVSCGVQALGMALDGLDGSAPSSASLLAFLEDNGMLYDFGTGVEELALAAQSFGFEGAFAFHDWTLDDLQTELDAGRPVVVALDADGEAGAGHFVTVTGISPDGQWVAFNDPTLGEQVLPADEFLRLWALQGSSGVAVRREAPAEGSAGYAPWVALLAGMMALITQTPLLRQRKGIGGSLEPGGAEAGGETTPTGYRWVFKQMPKYEWQEVQEGWDVVPKTVPNMVQKYEQVGWTTMTERIPRYKTIQVQDGWTYTYERVATYRTERYIRYWRTEYTYQPTYRYYYGTRIFAGYKKVARRVPVYGTRSVFAGWITQTKRESKMVARTVLAGYDVVEKRVAKYGWVERQDGWTTTTEQVPHMVTKQVQVGTEWRWVLEEVPPPAPPADPEPPPSPSDEDKLARIEEILDPVIPPELTREEVKLAAILQEEPVIGTDSDEAGAEELELQGNGSTPEPEHPTAVPVQTPTPESEATVEPTSTPTPPPVGSSDAEIAPPVPLPICPLTEEQMEALLNEQERKAWLRLEQLQRQAWLDSFWQEVMACGDSENPEACQIRLGLMIYDHYDLDLREIIARGEDNPIEGFEEVRFISDTLIVRTHNPVTLEFLKALGFDTTHISNFEPAFLYRLRRSYETLYAEINKQVAAESGIQEYIDATAWDDIIGPMYGGAPEMYIGDYPMLSE